jgi:hypothetical protein
MIETGSRLLQTGEAVSCNYASLAENLRTGTHLTTRFDDAVALHNGDWCRRDISEKSISEGRWISMTVSRWNELKLTMEDRNFK